MSAWWTKIQGVVKKHDGPRPKLQALAALSIHRWSSVPFSELGRYRKDPEKFPDTPDELPAMLEKAQKGRKR